MSELLLLVHGAWHGSWAWEPLLPYLAEAGVEARAVRLAGVDRAPGRHDLTGHAGALRAEIDAIDRPVVVLGHSYGGAVATEAAAGAPNVVRLIYLAGFLLAEGESCADANVPPVAAPDGLAPVLAGDYLTVAQPVARYMFYNGCPDEPAAQAAARLTPEHVGTVGAKVERAAWPEIPTTYLVCERDQALAPAAQHRMAARADERYSLDFGHSPMLGIPSELAALLAGCLGRARAAGP